MVRLALVLTLALLASLSSGQHQGEEINRLVRRLEPTRDTLAHWAVMDRLTRIGKPAVEPLIAALSTPKSSVRGAAIWILGEIGDPHATALLLKLVRSRDQSCLAVSVEALGNLGAKEAIPDLKTLTTHEEMVVRNEAAYSLARLGDVGVIPQLLKIMATGGYTEFGGCAYGPYLKPWGIAAAQALGMLGKTALPEILAAVDSTDPNLHKGGVIALGFVQDEIALARLRDYAQGPPSWDRVEAYGGLARLKDKRGLEIMLQRLGDEHETYMLLRALEIWPAPEALPRLA